MKSRIMSWFRTHKKMRVVIPSLLMMLVLLAISLPTSAALSYLDVTGTYDVSSRSVPRYTDNTRHVATQYGNLVITTQVGKAITVATLQHLGTDIDLTGIVGPGSRPNIVLAGTDSDGTVVSIQGRVTTDSVGDVSTIKGRIMGYVTSDGSRFEDSADGTSAMSVVAYHSEPLSTLLVGGTLANPEALLFHNPVNRMRLSNLSNLRTGQLGFWFNLEAATSPGPEIMLRFAPVGSETQSYYGGGTSGLVDITIMPYQAPYVGTGAWVECDVATDAATIVYYGNDPTDYTAFGGTPVASIDAVEAAINAEVAMTAGGDDASDWVLTMVSVELWEGGDRDCYIDDVTIGGILYTGEPNSYYSGFKATIQ